MAYKVIILYQLYMPSYFLGTFTEYPPFDINGAERTYRADIFTSPASDTNIGIHGRDRQAIFIRNHSHGLSRTMFGASPATGLVGIDDTIFADKNHPSHLQLMLFLFGKRQ